MTLQNAGTLAVLGRTEAATRGLSRFHTGEPCKKGHRADRYVSNRQCVTCNAAKAREREALRGDRDPSYRMYRNTLRRTGMALRGLASPSDSVGCDHEELRDHISSRFGVGMSWGCYRQWEVDHVEPLSAAKSLVELIELCHFSNLQPLWRGDNLRKGGA